MIDFIEHFRAALVWLLKRADRNQGEIAKSCNITPQYLTHIKNGAKDGTEDVRRRLASSLGYTYESMLSLGQWILEGNDPEEWPRPASASAGIGLFSGVEAEVQAPTREECDPEDNDEFVAIKKYRAKLSGGHGCFDTSQEVEANVMFRRDFLSRKGQIDKMALFEVIGNSMEPFIYDGDVVLVDMSQTDIVDGKAYAFREDHTVKVKRLSKQGGVVIATSENAMHYPAYPVDVKNFQLIGKVIWVGHEVK